MTISPWQSERIRELIAAVYGPDTGTEMIGKLLRGISEILHVEYHAIFLFPKRMVTDAFMASNNPADFEKAYASELFRHDFFLQRIQSVQEMVHLGPLVTPDVEKHDFFYNECQKIRPASDGWYLPVIDAGTLVGTMGFCREGRSSPPFTGNDLEIVRFLYPFLQEGIRRACRPGGTAGPAGGTGIVGTAYLDSFGSVVERDENAGGILRETFGARFQERPGSSPAPNGEELQRRFVRFLSGAPGPEDGRFTLQTPGGTVSCLLQRLDSPDFRRHFPPAPQVRLTLYREPATAGHVDRERVRSRFGLTDREVEVVSLLPEGHSNADIARRLGITEATVKRHLHTIFGKAGVGSRTQLIYVLTHEHV